MHNGHFKPGNSGRPKGSINKFRKAIREAVTETDIQDLISVLIRKGKQGNIQAVKLVLEYTAGKPTDHLSIEDETNKFQPVNIIPFEEYQRINNKLEDAY